MDFELIEKLKQKRNELSKRLNVEAFKILQNATIERIAEFKPTNLTELSQIKGIGPKKIIQFGKVILDIVNNRSEGEDVEEENAEGGLIVYSVSSFLDRLNRLLKQEKAKVRGEVGKVSARPTMIYFDLKDSEEGKSLISCCISRFSYELLGVMLTEGMEIVVSGHPDIYKMSGRMSFYAETVELVGEGRLKKAYEELKNKLEREGLFAPERKRSIPEFARQIGLITSRYGEAIYDFTSNLEQAGLSIKFFDARVEGQQAVFDLIKAIGWFNRNSEADVLVITRGGGSWESLQAFNNEAVCRAVAGSKIPVLTGIGHERDVPLACLAADKSVSTPTATAKFLSQPWREAKMNLHNLGNGLVNIFERNFSAVKNNLLNYAEEMTDCFRQELERKQNHFNSLAQELKNYFSLIRNRLPDLAKRLNVSLKMIFGEIKKKRERMKRLTRELNNKFENSFNDLNRQIGFLEKNLQAKNPEKLLKLGYSLVYKEGKIVRGVENLRVGQSLLIRLCKGSVDSEIKKIND